jgi:hypothetical protein
LFKGLFPIFGLFTLSTVLSFFKTAYSSLLSILDSLPGEMEFLSVIPIEGHYLAFLAVYSQAVLPGKSLIKRRIQNERN